MTPKNGNFKTSFEPWTLYKCKLTMRTYIPTPWCTCIDERNLPHWASTE
jgi:hypothetical protein